MKMELKLDDKWKIQTDKHNYKLIRKDKNGREFVESYLCCMEHAIMEFIDMNIRLSNAKSIQELIDELTTLRAGLNKSLQPLKLTVVPISELEKEASNE